VLLLLQHIAIMSKLLLSNSTFLLFVLTVVPKMAVLRNLKV